jgi:inorganic pyrophosphatase
VRSGSQDQSVDVLVEIPRGSRAKYELDQTTGRIRLDRVLFSSVHYPADYGFVMDTIGGDGDPLDALVVVEEPTFPGCVVPSRPIGTLLMRDEHGDDEKILAVPSAIRGSTRCEAFATWGSTGCARSRLSSPRTRSSRATSPLR